MPVLMPSVFNISEHILLVEFSNCTCTLQALTLIQEVEEIKMQSCDWSSMVEKEEKREERRMK